MILLEQVNKQYGELNAVKDVSFSVAGGETVVLLGTSGCGKTTTLRMINRLVESSSGIIMVNGQDIKTQPVEQLRRGIGYVLQHHGLFPHYTVAKNISIVPDLLKWEETRTKKRTAELLEKLQLPPNILHQYPQSLSGGQQQRVGLARALASNPPILLMDEPLGALDPITRAGIRKEFATLDELRSKTILMVTHDVQEAFELGDRICLMDKGEIVQIGTAKELLFHPATEFVSSFLQEQRFQLELTSISVNDIWTLLPVAVPGTEEVLLPGDKNIWEVLEMISAKKNGVRYFSTVHTEKRQITSASIMAAFTQFKNSL